MKAICTTLLFLALGTPLAAAPEATIKVFSAEKGKYIVVDRVRRTDEAWKRVLSPEQFRVTRMKGTERAFTGAFWNNHERGVYRCVCCGNDLFRSEDKFESGTGWPSYLKPIAPENIETQEDRNLYMSRTEVLCARCGAHLGHVFDDGPKPAGLRYCINSVALDFVKARR